MYTALRRNPGRDLGVVVPDDSRNFHSRNVPWNGNNASAVISRTGQRPGVEREKGREAVSSCGVLNSLLAPTMPTLNLHPSLFLRIRDACSRRGGGSERRKGGTLLRRDSPGNKATELTFRSHGGSTTRHPRPLACRVYGRRGGKGSTPLVVFA